MTYSTPKRTRNTAIIAGLVVLACLAIAGTLIARSLRYTVSAPVAGRMGPGGPGGGPGGGRNPFGDTTTPRYGGRVTAVDAAAGTITVETRDHEAMIFTVPATAKIIVKRATATLADIQVGYRAMVLSKDGKSAVDIASGPRRPRGPGGGPGGYGGRGGQGTPPSPATTPGAETGAMPGGDN